MYSACTWVHHELMSTAHQHADVARCQHFVELLSALFRSRHGALSNGLLLQLSVDEQQVEDAHARQPKPEEKQAHVTNMVAV